MNRFLCLDDFEPAARRRLPRSVHGYIAGGAERQATLQRNQQAYADIALCPRVLVNTSARHTDTPVFGQAWSAPFGIAPMGAMGVAAFQADLVMARAAAAENIPFVLSGSSLVALERVIEANPQAWFQAYLDADAQANRTLLARVAAAGYRTLVITVDVPVAGNREDDLRNGYGSPLRPSWKLALDAVLHPRWLFGTLLGTLLAEGMPQFLNYAAEPVPMVSRRARRPHLRDQLSWDDLARLRAQWPHRLVLKGVLSAADVSLAATNGVDAVLLSNHGGRQLDGAITAVQALPAAVAARPSSMPLFCDGGIRRGTDVIKALGLGASLVFIGRPLLFAAVAGGEAGVRRAIALLRAELLRNLALLGCNDLSDLGSRLRPQPRALPATPCPN